ncbi:ankyrin repeat-containing domain protein [Xylaria scruposa]|nr:ankyrin repeat-containing domain protein [Xylaria scruposa]
MASIHNLLDVCTKIIEYIQPVKDDSSERIRLMMEISSIKGILESLSATLRGAEATPELWSDTIRSINRKGGLLDSLQEVLVSVRDELGRAASAKGLKRMGESHLWPFEKKDAEERLKGSIRLLRLMPHEDENAIIQCQLFEYPLQKSGEETHVYEALSYVWGSEDDRQPIYIQSDDKADNHQMKRGFDLRSCFPTGNNGRLLVTANLHKAMLQLRGRLVERILWVDAICINQENNYEKGQQVQLMAKIFAKASCVIVWLGEAPDNNNQALEIIRKTAEEESTSAAIDKVNKESIMTMLKRPWFRRIWVLQEVAAARRVLVKYGPTEISGYAFFEGLSRLNLPYKKNPVFKNLILPAVYPMRGVVLRSGYKRDERNPLSTFSLNVRPLGELVDMHHIRKATNRLDKVYALLGMSSDDPSKAGLLANYDTSWGEVFRKLIKFSLSDQMSVSTWDDKEVAVIEGKGYVLGVVSSVESDNDRQRVHVSGKYTSSRTHFTTQTLAKPVQTSKPTIIRLCGNVTTIIMIAAPLTDDMQKRMSLARAFPNDLLLVWDWLESGGKLQGGEDSKYLMKNRGVPKCLKTGCQCHDYLDESVRQWNAGLLLNSIGRYENAAKNLRNAVESYMAGVALRSRDKTDPGHGPWRKNDEEVLKVLDDLLHTSTGAKYPGHSQTPLLWALGKGHKAVSQQLLDKGADINVKQKDNRYRTPLIWAAEEGHEAAVQLLLDKGADIEAKDNDSRTPLLLAVKNKHEAIVQLLLDKGANIEVKDELSRTPLLTAVENGHKAVDHYNRIPLLLAVENKHEAIMQLLLDKGADIEAKGYYGRTPLLLAIENGHEAVVRQLLNKGADIDTTDDDESKTPLTWAAEHGHKAISGTPLVYAAGNGHEAVSVYDCSRTPLANATSNGHEAIVQLLLNKGADTDAKDDDSWTPLIYAAGYGHKAIVQLLLDKGADVDAEDNDGQTPLSRAAENGHKAIVQLLLDKGADVDAEDNDGRTPLFWATENEHHAMKELLKSHGAESLYK